MTRTKYHFIFSYIKLNQILSITLSDGEFTAGQMALFLKRYSSLFHLFTRRHSLTPYCAVINKNKYMLLIQALKQFPKIYIC
jgi:hypothetical protein